MARTAWLARSVRAWRGSIALAGAFILSVVLLAYARQGGDPAWLSQHLPPAPGADGILWQVQTTFLSVGFAGLAIAAQLFAEAPFTIGASRGRVLKYIGASRFVGIGLVANAVIGIETIWLPSGLGLLGVSMAWFIPTVVLLVWSTSKLVNLFGHPSLLDEFVRTSLIESLSSRIDDVSHRYSEATKRLDGLVTLNQSCINLGSSTHTLRVPVPEVGVVIKAIKTNAVKQALKTLEPRATDSSSSDGEIVAEYTAPQIILDVVPGDRTRLGETVFRVLTHDPLDEAVQDLVIRLLESSIEFENSEAVTPDEETDRDIANLKDAIGTNIRAGAFATAERAAELLGHVVRGVWKRQDETGFSRRVSTTRRDWLFRSISDVEQDVVQSPRAAGMFVSLAMTRALEAPRVGSPEYVDECLRSFTRIWLEILQEEGSEFEQVSGRIIVCVQNLAMFSPSGQRVDLPDRATWAMVELVKLALDAHKPKAAVRAAEELSGLFEYSHRGGNHRAHVRAGQLVLAGWLDYLADKGDDRNPDDAGLRMLVTPHATWAEILAARRLVERGQTPFSRWEWWETTYSGSVHAQVLELSSYIDMAQLGALTSSYGPLPPATDQHTASEYQRLRGLLAEKSRDLTPMESNLGERLAEEIEKWTAAEEARLAAEPLSDTRIAALRKSLLETLNDAQRLADRIPQESVVSESADVARPILGMNLRVPRHYFVEEIFNQTYANPEELGSVIARGMTTGEEKKIVKMLESLQSEVLESSATAILGTIRALGDQAEHFVLLTPYGGLRDVDVWYSVEFLEALAQVTRIETSTLDDKAIMFDSRSTLVSCRNPEGKDGLVPVGSTSISMGVFEDADDGEEPRVRVETGEYFVLWPGDAPHIFQFGAGPMA